MKSAIKGSDSATQKCHQILEENGGKIAEKSRSILLSDSKLKELKEPLEFISKNWRDPLTPSLLALSCKAVGGIPRNTHNSALAISLINLSFFLWDDIIDHSSAKIFKPTLSGKYGSGTALIVGGMISAKAFSILNNLKFKKIKKEAINRLIWDLLSIMAKAEMHSIKMRSQKNYSSGAKLWKIKTESIDPQTCLRIGAIIGDGSDREIECLGNYGSNLGVILGLMNDFRVAANLTLELATKIKLKALPYSLLLATERSEKLRKRLEKLLIKDNVDQASIKLIVEGMLETLVLEDIQKKVDFFVQRAKESLNGLKQNSATITLQSFIELQPRFFVESIPFLES
jgi:geranylgeranyl pyrophosphate synthase